MPDALDHPSAAEVSFDFAGRVAIVTGATGGIGGAIADGFAQSGADLIVHGRKEDVLAEVVRRAEDVGVRAVGVTGNIREAQTAERLVQTALDSFGKLDFLINNAGGNFGALLENLSDNAWNATIESNFSGPFRLAKLCVPAFRANGGGVVVNIGSASAGYAHPLRGAYAAAKAGLASITRTMAWEWAADDVRVNCLEPGAVVTEASRFANSAMADRVAHYVASGRLGRPEDIASVCLFLCSDGAGYLNGQSIEVNGGPKTATPADIEQLHEAISSARSGQS